MNRKKLDVSTIKTYLSNYVLLSLYLSFLLYLLVYANELVIFIYPIVPLVYGWKTKNVTGSVLIGMLPITFLFLDLHMANLENYTPGRFDYVIAYFAKLIILGGINGYLAAKLPKQYFILLLIIGTFVWYALFMSGID